MNANALLERLDAIDRKLDRIERRQLVFENLVDEMTPVAREVVRSTGERMSELEARGYFAFGRQMLELVDRIVTHYGADGVQELSGHVEDLLLAANEAAEVLGDADHIEPVNMFGAVRATRDQEVQHGLGIAIEVLRHLGRIHDARTTPSRPLEPPTREAYFTPAPARPTTPEPEPAETVQWNGRTFTGDGFLVDAQDWDEALANAMAEAMGLELSDERLEIVRWAREEYLSSGASPNVRRVATGSGAGTRRVYELFPRSPGKTVAMLAGIPKPVGCI